MAKLTAALAVLVILACAAMATAAPCMECKDCQGIEYCKKVCQKTCPTSPPSGQTTQLCESYGSTAAAAEAQKACDLTMAHCLNPVHPAKPSWPTSLNQCATTANGVCQAHAMDPHKSPCSKHFGIGYLKCSGPQFQDFYTEVAKEGCKNAVQWIQTAGKIGRRLKL